MAAVEEKGQRGQKAGRTERKERVSYRARSQRGKLHVNLTEGDKKQFQHRWVNATGDRIAELEEIGYERVTREVEGGSVRHGGKDAIGGSQKMVLMRIPREYFDEDQEAKREERGSLIEQIRKSQKGDLSNLPKEGKLVRGSSELSISDHSPFPEDMEEG